MEEKLVLLAEAYATAVESPLFNSNEELIEKAIDALLAFDPDSRWRKQFRSVAIRNLLTKAAKTAKDNVPYPAEDAILEETNRLLANRKAKAK